MRTVHPCMPVAGARQTGLRIYGVCALRLCSSSSSSPSFLSSGNFFVILCFVPYRHTKFTTLCTPIHTHAQLSHALPPRAQAGRPGRRRSHARTRRVLTVGEAVVARRAVLRGGRGQPRAQGKRSKSKPAHVRVSSGHGGAAGRRGGWAGTRRAADRLWDTRTGPYTRSHTTGRLLWGRCFVGAHRHSRRQFCSTVVLPAATACCDAA